MYLLWIAIAVIVLMALVGSITKAQAKAAHHDRCAQCDEKLRFKRNRYSLVCTKCGTRQPWAPKVVE